jgi:hypothetical protein
MRRTFLATMALLASTSAFAQTIDDQGASALAESLKRYLGQTAFEKKIVTVTPDGDAYKLGFDIPALISLFPAQDAVVKIDPYALRLKPLADGKWDVAGSVAPNGSFSFKGPEGQPQAAEWSVVDGKFSGIYDPAITYFSSASGSTGLIKFSSTEGPQKADVSIASGSFQLSGKAGANGGVDVTQTQTLTDFVETITGPAGEGLPDMTLTLKSPKLDVNADGTGFRMAQFLDILAFGVANSEPEKFKAAQPEFKQLLLAALPLWDKMSGTYAFSDFVTETPAGAFSTSKLGINVAMDGIGKAGTLTYGISAAALKMPDGIAPPWSVPILPTDVNLQFGGANLNLDGPARKFIEAMDITQDPPVPEAVSQEILAEFLASNPKVTVTDTSIKNKDTEFTINGEATFPQQKPDVKATIVATGFDKLEAAMQAAASADPTAQQVFPMILAAKGFGKVQPDGKIEWLVEVKPDGSMLVNGTMLKGPDPVAPEVPVDPNAPAPGLTNPAPN